ncbi:Gpi16p PIG-T family glycosyl phosphatidyl inositol 16 signal peptide and transmembrane domain or GPI anchor [Cryptosporidium sp. chipmunk genotype I]|uniref:Gpi16p PIG-T family glycosyl phosphatidyl inositol 16 signal peptide and transmembrane domain or GPI anchor n=1 Tax=Cryptosporidium sp. chipmunk genotype I TaxID=1280935 RepID=UPI00351A972C|nr:Gpi16p PIG-T family glycosyl phosphatidyl inositol 16 signal peptide and transmembrane domain or GPI anchor [Cryptosporidium sp. chipmunk genotype I]
MKDMNVLEMSFLATCLILIVLIGFVENNENREKYLEKTIINRLPHKSRYFLGYELEIEVDNDLTKKDYKFISNELLELLQIPFLDDMLLVSTQGMWRTSNWGEPPVDIYTTGSILDLGFSDASLVSEELWSSILAKVSSIMCNSLTVFNNALNREKSCTQVMKGTGLNRQICNNYDDTLCMDNLNCWRKLLPCMALDYSSKAGSYGILKKISLDSFVKASYKSIGLKFKRRGKKAYFRIFFNIVLKVKHLSVTRKGQSETLWSLIGLEEPEYKDFLCPVVVESKIIYFLNSVPLKENVLSYENNNICNIVSYRHPVHHDLFSLEMNVLNLNNSTIKLSLEFLKQVCGVKWIKHISALNPYKQLEDKSKLSFLHVDRSYVKSVIGDDIKSDRTEGSLVIALDNLLSEKSIRICHWEQFPRYINPWFYNTRVLSARSKVIKNIVDIHDKNDDILIFDSFNALQFLNLKIYKSENILVNFCIDLAPNTNVIVIFKFQKYFLPLEYLGAKAKRGQISPPSVSYWRIQEESRENDYRTIYHNINIIPTIFLDHTMTFNVVAITSAFIIFGIVTTTKSIQLSLKNISIF